MDYQAQLKLQAFLDGELLEGEARDVANWLARDQEAAALLAELRQTRQAMMEFETGVRVPVSREFYWSKIQHEIERLDSTAPEPVAIPLFARLRRFLLPAGALAALVVAGLLAALHQSGPAEMETVSEDMGAFTYHDYAAGATLIWLSDSAENEFADGEPGDMLD